MRIVAALLFAATVLAVGSAEAQQQLPVLPDGTVLGRIGVVGDGGFGPSGAIPFGVLSGLIPTSSLPVGQPLLGNGVAAITAGTKTGNTTEFPTWNGSTTNGHCVSIDSNGNLLDAGGPCTTGGGGGTVASGTAGQIAAYLSTGATVTGESLSSALTAAGLTARTQLTGPLTIYVNNGTSAANCNGQTCQPGSDTTGTGTISAPYKTRTKAYSVLQSSYDLNLQTVTIQLTDGTDATGFQIFGPMLTGQGGIGGLIFQGNCTTPANTLIQPAAGLGYAYGFFFGASAKLQCQKVDQTNQRSIYPNGADIVDAAHNNSGIIFGPGMIFGCDFQGFNALSISFNGYVEFDNDFTVDVGLCQESPNATYSNSSASITVSSATGLVPYMRVQASGNTSIPLDAYISPTYTIGSTTVPLACWVTNPCQTSAAETNNPMIISGGGQMFLQLGPLSQQWVNSNGQSDFGIIVTLANYPSYTFWTQSNGLSYMFAQALTFIGPGQANGQCFSGITGAIIDTEFAGVPFFPCFASGIGGANVQGVTLTSGSNSFTVAGTVPQVGQAVNGYVQPTGTWTAGSSTISLSNASGVCIGAVVQGPGILTGAAAVISNLVGTTATLSHCAGGPRCVSGYPTYLSETNANIIITGCGVKNGTLVTGVSGTTVTISTQAKTSGTQQIIFEGATSGNAQYNFLLRRDLRPGNDNRPVGVDLAA